MARRTKDEVAAVKGKILKSMRDGMSMTSACGLHKVSTNSWMEWVAADEKLAGEYAGAREAAIEKMAEDLMKIADEPVGTLISGGTDSGAVQKQRLQVDTRKWLLSKMAPKKYGEKIEQTITGADGGPVEFKQIVVSGK